MGDEMLSIKDRYSGIQDILGDCKDGGCHFLILLSIAEECRKDLLKIENYYIDLIEAIRVSHQNGWFTEYFWGTENQLKLLEYYTGKKWTRSQMVQDIPGNLKKNQFTEVVYQNDSTGYNHFTRRYLDTLKNSVTVKNGYILGYYIYTCEV